MPTHLEGELAEALLDDAIEFKGLILRLADLLTEIGMSGEAPKWEHTIGVALEDVKTTLLRKKTDPRYIKVSSARENLRLFPSRTTPKSYPTDETEENRS